MKKKIIIALIIIAVALVTAIAAVVIAIGTKMYDEWKNTNHVENMFCQENGLDEDTQNKVYIPERRADEEEYFSWTDTFVFEKFVLNDEESKAAESIIEKNDVWYCLSEAQDIKETQSLASLFDREEVEADIDWDTCMIAAYDHRTEEYIEPVHILKGSPWVSYFVYDAASQTYYYLYYDM
ncbi:MAG: hypothetical protein IJA52_06210 [Clostridia bacterium]|nr:hypothetical protein [Clostridia bacterium]